MSSELGLLAMVVLLVWLPCVFVPLHQAEKRGGALTVQETAFVYLSSAALWAVIFLPVLEVKSDGGLPGVTIASHAFYAAIPLWFVLALLAMALRSRRHLRVGLWILVCVCLFAFGAAALCLGAHFVMRQLR